MNAFVATPHIHTNADQTRARSNQTFIGLMLISAILAFIIYFLPQGNQAGSIPTDQLPMPLAAYAAINAAIILVVYGALGAFGLFLSRKIGVAEIWEPHVTNRQRFILPLVLGVVLGVALILSDMAFATINGIGRFIHPPFPTSIVASILAGINEEVLFRLFFTSFWTWLIGKVILRGRGLVVVYWVVSIIAALAFGASHIPAVMVMLGSTSPNALSPVLIAELLLLNGLISLVAAYLFKRFGLLAASGVHFWTDIVWHVIWGLF